MFVYNVIVTEMPKIGVVCSCGLSAEPVIAQERLVKDASRRYFAIIRGGEPSLVLSGLAEVAVWATEDGKVAKLEVELLKPYSVDESYVQEFLANIKW